MAEETVGAKLAVRGRSGFSRDMKGAARDVDQLGDKAERAGRRASIMGRMFAGAKGGIGAAARVAKTGAVALLGLGVAAGAAGFKFLQMSLDAGETASKFETVLGDVAGSTQKWINDLHATSGIAITDLQDATSTFAVLGKQAGKTGTDLQSFSTDLTQAALDLGSFHNADPSEVFDAMRSGLTGEAEPLKRFNIFMNEASLNAFALEQGIGKTTQKMTEQEKVALRQAFILSQLGDAEGDLARTQDSGANQWKRMIGIGKQLATTLGDVLKPAAETLLPVMGDGLYGASQRLTDRLPALQEKVEAVSKGFLDFTRRGGKQFRNLLDAIGDRDIDGIAEVLDNIFGNSGRWVTPIRELGMVVEDVGIIVSELLVPAWNDAKDALPLLVSPLGILRGLLGYVADNAEDLYPLVTSLTAGFLAYKGVMVGVNTVTAISNGLKYLQVAGTLGVAAAQAGATATTLTFSGVMAGLNAVLLANPIGLVVVAIGLLVAAFVLAYQRSETFRNGVQRAFTAVKVAGLSMAETVVGVFRSMVNFYLSAVEDIVGGAAKAASALGMKDLAADLRDAQGDITRFKDGANRRLSEIETGLQIQIDTARAEQQIRNLGTSLNALTAKHGYVDAAVRQVVNRTPGAFGTEPRAAGGPVWPGQQFLVGEHGPELVVPQGRATVVPAAPTQRLMSARGGDGAGLGGGISVNIDTINTTGDADDIADQIVEAVKKPKVQRAIGAAAGRAKASHEAWS